MRRRLAQALCAAAGRLLPPGRRAWGEAMAAELAHVEPGGAALEFAAGCLLAAGRARVGDGATQIVLSWWSLAVATAALAAARLACAGRGMAVLLGAPDGMRAGLAAAGADPVRLSAYDAARPIVIACFVALGVAELASAWCLARGRLYGLLLSWAAALLIGGTAVGIQLSIAGDIDGVPSEFHAALLQALAVPVLLLWSRRQARENAA